MDKRSFVDRLMRKPAAEVDDGVINAEKCIEWAGILGKYKSGKSNLEARIKENQQYWRLMHWRDTGDSLDRIPAPTSAWLTNVILAKHAARMDAYPEAIVLPRELSDESEAQNLTSILPCVLDRCEFRETFSKVGWDKQISCAGCYFVGWNQQKYNGLGDIEIAAVDLLNLYWEPGILDIQDSKYVFVVNLIDKDVLQAQYPQLKDRSGKTNVIVPSEYVYEDAISSDGKEAVVDVYYKKNINGKTILHYAKFVQDAVLYATENETAPVTDAMGNVIGTPMAEKGLYDHGKYPFVIESLYPAKGSLAGFGYVDICKDPQKYIDIMGAAILKNVQDNATPRYFVRSDAAINVEEFNDLSRRTVKCNGNLGQDSVRLIDTKSLEGNVLNFYQFKIDEMKQTAGNRDVTSGGAEGGVTAASAIAIMQESGSALSRDENDTAYRAFKRIITICIELIRQFYTLPRFFRIEGDRGVVNYTSYESSRIQAQKTLGIDGMEYIRIPEFDLEINSAAEADYSKQSMNQLALQFYQAGFFNPENYISSVQCLDMMDFKGKEKMQQNMERSALMFQSMMAAPTSGHTSPAEKQATDESKAEAARARGEKAVNKAEANAEAGVKPN